MLRIAPILLLLVPNLALAHGVELSLQVGEPAVVGRASYADGSPMVGVAVVLQSTTGSSQRATVGQSMTDADGRFAFPAPRGGGEFRVTAEDGLGHRGATSLNWRDAEPAEGPKAPVVTIEHRDSRPHWQLWLSGLGYLLGVFGAGAWWLSRRKVVRARE